jgi:hypothetical protein
VTTAGKTVRVFRSKESSMIDGHESQGVVIILTVTDRPVDAKGSLVELLLFWQELLAGSISGSSAAQVFRIFREI